MARGYRGRDSKPSRGARESLPRGGGRGRGGSSSSTPRNKDARDAELDREVLAVTTRLGFPPTNIPPNKGGRGRGGFRRGPPRFNEFQYTYRGSKHQRGQGLGFQSPYDGRRSDPPAPRQAQLLKYGDANRPLLKPVTFVRAGTLFQDHNEIFKATAVDHEDDSAPTANQIDDVFAHGFDSSQAPTISNTPRNISHTNLTRFTDPSLDTMFDSADDKAIPVISWPFTAAQLEASAVQMEYQTTETNKGRSSLTKNDAVDRHTIVSTVSAAATLNDAMIIPAEPTEQPATNIEIDINKLFEMAALESALPKASTANNKPAQMLAGPRATNVTHESQEEHTLVTAVSEGQKDEEFFFFDTDGAAEPAREIEASSKVHSSAASTSTLQPVARMPEKTSDAFIVAASGDKGSTVNPKIRYRVHRLDAASRPLGEYTDSSSSPSPQAEEDDGDDIVVFVPTASGSQSRTSLGPLVPDISLANAKFSIPETHSGKSRPNALSRQLHDGWKKKLKKQEKRKRRKARHRAERQIELAGFREPEEGAQHPNCDPRLGDSDLEWGSDGPPAGPSDMRSGREDGGRTAPVHDASDNDHGMDVDPDLDIEDAQYERMLAGLLGDRDYTTIDDIGDQAKLLAEDNDVSDEESDSSSVQVGAGVENFDLPAETQLEVEDDDNEPTNSLESADDLSSPDEDEDISFRTQLSRMRARALDPHSKSKGASEAGSYNEEDDDELFGGGYAWQDQDDDDAAWDIQDMLDHGLPGKNRKERKETFRAIVNGDFGNEILSRNMDIASGIGKKKKKQGAYVPSELQDIWERDRATKAEYKRARAEKRRLALLGHSSASRSRGKGKGKACSDDDFEHEPEEGTISLVSLTAEIRLFVNDPARETMALPPMERESRKRVHDIAAAFHLKSKSTGKDGGGRRIVLTRISRTGTSIREGKIAAVLKRSGFDVPVAARAHGTARHREGDIVGQKAAKIDEDNVGFKLLQRMGWKEGERIGVTGGLAAPLTAVIKTSKLGLGAGTVRWST